MVPSGAPCAGRDIEVFDWHPKGGRWIHITAYAETLEKVLRAKGVAPRRFKRLMPQPSLPGWARLTEHEDGQERARAAKRLGGPIPEGGADQVIAGAALLVWAQEIGRIIRGELNSKEACVETQKGSL